MSKSSNGSIVNNRGFTLVELVLVLVIMGLALGVSYPMLSRGTATFHLRATGREILNALRYAREKAITEQVEMRIVADREKQLLVLTDAFGAGDRSYAMPHDVRIERVLLSGQEVVDGPLVLRFLPNGSSDNAEIVIRSTSGASLKVETDPLTGGARIGKK